MVVKGEVYLLESNLLKKTLNTLSLDLRVL